MKCPCNPKVLYVECCKKAHTDITNVSSAEILMRSRYSAFVLANIEYLAKSHHSSTRLSKNEYQELKKWTESVNWIKLDVLKSTQNTVHFKAYFFENGSVDVIEEHSSFTKENNHWVYLDKIH